MAASSDAVQRNTAKDPNAFTLSALAVRVKVIGNNLIDDAFMVPDEIVARHAGGLPQGLKAGVSMKPLVSGLMVELMASRVL